MINKTSGLLFEKRLIEKHVQVWASELVSQSLRLHTPAGCGSAFELLCSWSGSANVQT